MIPGLTETKKSLKSKSIFAYSVFAAKDNNYIQNTNEKLSCNCLSLKKITNSNVQYHLSTMISGKTGQSAWELTPALNFLFALFHSCNSLIPSMARRSCLACET